MSVLTGFHPFCPMWEFCDPWQISGLLAMLRCNIRQKDSKYPIFKYQIDDYIFLCYNYRKEVEGFPKLSFHLLTKVLCDQHVAF